MEPPFTLRFDGVTVPGLAGELQARQASVALVAELGGNYATYHDFLARAIDSAGRPEVAQFQLVDDYLNAWNHVQALVRAEAGIRMAAAMQRRTGDPVAAMTLVPLIEGDRLVDMDKGAP
jgi:hypothetical protein